MTTRALVDERFSRIVEIRRALHARPELSFEEHATTALVRAELRALGATELSCPTRTGAVFAVDGGRPGRTVLLRADLDALPVHESVELPFRSKVAGVMHACGHDAHTAMLLGVAEILAARSNEIPGRYVFLFQPAEERISGARAMIEGGLLESVRADRLIGCHVLSVFPAGTVCLRPGIALAGGQGLRFDLRGSGGHGAFPGRPGNVVTAVGELLRGLPSVVDGLEHEGTSCACSAGVVQAGTALNVLPVSAIVEGTLRTFSEAQKAEALSRLRALCGRITEQTGVEVAIGASPFHAPPVVNDAAASALVRAATERALGSERVLTGPPFPASDDVSEFLRRVPGCYFFVGAARSDGTSGMHHSPTFAIDEEALRTGMVAMADGAVALAAD